MTAGDIRMTAAAAVDRSGAAPRVACVNGDPDRVFEIGSVTKALTGMLLADMIGRGEVTLGTPIGELLPQFAGNALGSVTIHELCTHTSGLPRLPRSPALFGRAVLGQLVAADPYRNPSVASVLDAAGRQAVRGRGSYRYSNLGAAVLGQGLAARAGLGGRGRADLARAGTARAGTAGAGTARAGTAQAGTAQEPAEAGYAALLTDRILAPLGMTTASVAVPGNAAAYGRSPARGWSANGRRQRPWLIGGYGPAGGVTATIGDMALLAARLVDGSAPGMAALDPIDFADSTTGGRRSGMFWIVDPGPAGSESVTWHNGMTGGYSAIIRIRRHAGTAVVVLSEVADGARITALARDLEKVLFAGADTAADR